MNSNKMLKML